MQIELVDFVSDELLQAVNHLLPQLSSSAGAMSFEQLDELISQPDVHFFVCREETEDVDDPGYDSTVPGRIQGMLTLVTFKIPTGVRAWIEDVAVDSQFRGQGGGQALVEAACQFAERLGARSVDLTSRPSREAANRLYQRCGFQLRETNVYRYSK